MTVTTGRAPASSGWEGLTSDGHVVRIRPVGVSDGDQLGSLTDRLQERTVYLRFFSLNREAARRYLVALARPADPDHDAVVAEVADTVVAVAGWDRTAGAEAEVGLLVDDAHQHRGIGMLLLEELRTRAAAAGIERLVAETLPENRRMLDVLGASGLHGTRVVEQGVTRTVLQTTLDDAGLALVDGREAHAERASLRPLLAPRSVVVVGAGRDPANVGHQVLRSILQGGFTGAVHAVNPSAVEVAGLPTYAAVGQVPGPVDLAVVAVPAARVLDVVEQCGAAGVRAAVILTAGLGETGDAGLALQRQVLLTGRRHDMRLVGPNCLGVVSTDPAVRLAAWFGPSSPADGPAALATQSGAVGVAIADRARAAGLGLAALVSLGNKVDVSGNDLLLTWWQDPRVRVVMLYLESLGNPRKFARIAARVGRTTPVLVVKGGRAGRSHTAEATTPEVAVDALFDRSGVVRLDGVGALVDTARLLAAQPVPDGGRLGIVGNGGGAGVLAADAATAHGLTVPLLDVPGQNPVDLGAGAGADALRAALEQLAATGGVDALLVSLTATRANDVPRLLSALGAAEVGALPVLVHVLGVPDAPAEVPLARGDCAPVYQLAEDAVVALAASVRYGRWRRTPPGVERRPTDVRPEDARCRLEDHDGAGWLGVEAVGAVLTAYGIPVLPAQRCATPGEAAAAADRLGLPAVVKTLAPGVVHKTDVGGVALGLGSGDEVRAAVAAMTGRLGGDVLVQPMARGVVELVAGVTREAEYGPVAMVGLGGVWTDLVRDRAFGLVPLPDLAPAALLRSLRCAPLLDGFRGAPAVDVGACEDMLLRLSTLAVDLPQVAELDLNPVLAGPEGVIVVDARIRVAPPDPVPDELARRLRG